MCRLSCFALLCFFSQFNVFVANKVLSLSVSLHTLTCMYIHLLNKRVNRLQPQQWHRLINQTLEACSWVSRCQQWYMFKRFTWTNTFATCRRRGRQQGAFSTNRLRTLWHKPVTKQPSIRSTAAAAASGSVARRWHTSRWRWNCTSLLIQLVAHRLGQNLNPGPYPVF